MPQLTGFAADAGADAVAEAARRLIDAIARTGQRMDDDAADLVTRIDCVAASGLWITTPVRYAVLTDPAHERPATPTAEGVR